MAEKKETKTTAPAAVKKKAEKAKNGLTYADKLEARAQRGQMTHQKRLAIAKSKKKEMKGE